MGDRLSSLGDDNFFALTDAIEELDDVSGGFGEGDVGDHRVDLLYDRSIINCGGRAIATESIGRTHGDARFSSKYSRYASTASRSSNGVSTASSIAWWRQEFSTALVKFSGEIGLKCTKPSSTNPYEP